MAHVVPIFAGVLIVNFGYVLATRALRRFVTRVGDASPQPTFDMSELRSMLDGGLISREEFERLKALLLAQRGRSATLQRSTDFEVVPMAKPHDPESERFED